MRRGFPYGTSITCKKEGKIYVEGRILRSVTMSRDSRQIHRSPLFTRGGDQLVSVSIDLFCFLLCLSLPRCATRGNIQRHICRFWKGVRAESRHTRGEE